MEDIIQNHNLSIIAVRILPNCRDSVRKCLKENIFYYLNTNYRISPNGDSIKPHEGYVEDSNDDFFRLDGDRPLPNISISAIVGKNGDGKSTLIELIIRLINNFACKSGLNPYRHLVYVEGVYGELYFRHDNKFYRIRIDNKRNELVLIYEYQWENSIRAYKLAGKHLTEQEIRKAAFYTLVSNYSHFAYNTEEYHEEDLPDAIGGHWLHHVFHKNDAYQAPLNIHPYREKGNININRERLLSTQRLLTSIANSFLKRDDGHYDTALDINGKVPYELYLKDIGKSKLLDITLLKYFQDNKNVNILKNEIDIIKEASFKQEEDPDLQEALIGDIAGEALSRLSRSYVKGHRRVFLKSAAEWLEKQHLIERNSDLRQLIENINYKDRSYCPGLNISEGDLANWEDISRLSVLQFLRLCLVYDICKMWNRCWNQITGPSEAPIRFAFNPINIFKDYESLSNQEKCYHYIIYKTIEVFSNYEAYGNPIAHYTTAETFISFRRSNLYHGTLYNLTGAFEQLGKDWKRKSHNTLKLRQTFNLLAGRNSSRKLYGSIGRYKGKTLIFEHLKEEYIQTLSDIETLPPPIFSWEIKFKKDGEEKPIPFQTFSSGEKQKLFFQTAVVYHLQNLNNVGEVELHYNAVNLIFEEIELYFHPEWQRRLIYDLMKAIRAANIPNITSVNMIFVTHSPYILSDIPKSNVLFLKDGTPTYEMQENTFGANINSLLKNGFFLPSLLMGEFAYRKINNLFEKLHSGEFGRMNINQLYAQIMTVGEPAIRTQLMTLFAPYNILRRSDGEILENLRRLLTKPQR